MADSGNDRRRQGSPSTGRSPSARSGGRGASGSRSGPASSTSRTTTKATSRGASTRRTPATRRPTGGGIRSRLQGRFAGLSTAKLVVLAAVVIGLALTLAVPIRTYLSQRNEFITALSESEQLRQEVADLQAEQDRIHDESYVRAQARERLGYVTPGETPYQVQLPGARTKNDVEVPEPTASGNWYGELWSQLNETPEDEQTVRNIPDPIPLVDNSGVGG